VLRRVTGPKIHEVTSGWRKMHYCYGDETKKGAALMPEMRSEYKILVGNLKWKRNNRGIQS
jgi:hypothetical protein